MFPPLDQLVVTLASMQTSKPIPIEEFNQKSDIPEYQINGKISMYQSDKRTGVKQELQLKKWGYKCDIFITTNDSIVELYFFKTSTFNNITREISMVKRLLDPRKLNIKFLTIEMIKFGG